MHDMVCIFFLLKVLSEGLSSLLYCFGVGGVKVADFFVRVVKKPNPALIRNEARFSLK